MTLKGAPEAMPISMEEARTLWPHPKKLTLEELNNLPYMGVCQGFLSCAEADKIIELSEKKGFEKSHTGSTTQGGMYGAMDTGNPYGKIFLLGTENLLPCAFSNVMPMFMGSLSDSFVRIQFGIDNGFRVHF
jgi:hypothetical protein